MSSEYALLFRGGADMQQFSPEEMQKHMGEWQSWIGQLVSKDIFIKGDPLAQEGTVLSKKNGSITDGPFAESKEAIGGYVILKADSLAEASEHAKDCPILEVQGEVEIRPITPM